MSYGYEAVKMLAQAKHDRTMGNYDHAAELLNQIINLGETHKEFINQYPYCEAHRELSKVYEALGQKEEATRYYWKAISLGAQTDK